MIRLSDLQQFCPHQQSLVTPNIPCITSMIIMYLQEVSYYLPKDLFSQRMREFPNFYWLSIKFSINLCTIYAITFRRLFISQAYSHTLLASQFYAIDYQ